MEGDVDMTTQQTRNVNHSRTQIPVLDSRLTNTTNGNCNECLQLCIKKKGKNLVGIIIFDVGTILRCGYGMCHVPDG
jgi:hypothetical protein